MRGDGDGEMKEGGSEEMRGGGDGEMKGGGDEESRPTVVSVCMSSSEYRRGPRSTA